MHKDLLNYKMLYKDIYEFHKQWYNINKSDFNGFEKMNNDAYEICKKYNNNKFVIDLLVAILGDIERKEC